MPSHSPIGSPSMMPSQSPSLYPTQTQVPSDSPTVSLSMMPSNSPIGSPSMMPSQSPSLYPTQTQVPSDSPTVSPSMMPSNSPSVSPSMIPSQSPSLYPTETLVSEIDIIYANVVEVNNTKFNLTSISDILVNSVHNITADALSCPNSELSLRDEQGVKQQRIKKEKKQNNLNSVVQRRKLQPKRYLSSSSCIAWNTTVTVGNLFVFSCPEEPKVPNFQCAFYLLSIIIRPIDGSLIPSSEAEIVREDVLSAVETAIDNGFIDEKFNA